MAIKLGSRGRRRSRQQGPDGRACGTGGVFGEAWRSSRVWPTGGRGRESDRRPSADGGLAYSVERGLEEEDTNANAVLQALIADYCSKHSFLTRCQRPRSCSKSRGAVVRSGAAFGRRIGPAICRAGRQARDRGTRITASSGTCPEGRGVRSYGGDVAGWDSVRWSSPMAGRRGARACRGSSLDWRVECREVWSACPSWEAV